nr:MAG TPA: hypothetical protein [Caudoviricetes sp.]
MKILLTFYLIYIIIYTEVERTLNTNERRTAQ